MRVIITAKQSLAPHSQAILGKLVAIIGETSKNPSNPRFNQYTFESISALIRLVAELAHASIQRIDTGLHRFVSAGNPSVVEHFEQSVFPPLEYMLSNDVTGEHRRRIIGGSRLTLNISTSPSIRIHAIRLPNHFSDA
jgi:exportin-2 (importin alpha re-exporter)